MTSKYTFLFSLLFLLGNAVIAQSVTLYWEEELLNSQKPLSEQDIIEEDVLTVKLAPDAAFKKKYPNSEAIELISFEALHTKNQKPLGAITINDSNQLPLKPLKIIKGEKIILK
ncbi:MAG: hypothetical protein AAF734_11875, partial [Bacteroidota bacterium]